MHNEPRSPYAEALHIIKLHPGTGGAVGLAKLLLSVWNGYCCFSFRDCVGSLDDANTALALRVVTHFARFGEDEELRRIGHEVNEEYPRLWELAEAANTAMSAVRAQWERERQASRQREEDE